MSNLPVNSFESRIQRSTSVRPLIVAFAAVAILIVAAAYLVLRSYSRTEERAEGAMLLATARLQSELIRSNIARHAQDARLLALRSVTWRSVDPRTPANLRRSARHGLALAVRQTEQTYGYKQCDLFDRALRQVYPLAQHVEADERQFLQRVLDTRTMQLLPLRVDSSGALEYGVAYPVFADGDSTTQVAGVVYLVIDATEQLLPLLSQEQDVYRGKESVLSQFEGGAIAFVAASGTGGGLRPLSLRSALSDTLTVGAKLHAADSNTIVHGTDYRGVPVFAGGRRVLGTPWLVIAKQETAARSKEQRAFTDIVIATAASLILLTAVVLRMLLLLATRRAMNHHFALASRYLAATTSSIDGWVLLGADGRILDVNPALERITGYSREELLARSVADLKVGLSVAEMQSWLAHIAALGSARFQSQWRTRDGASVDIDVSSSYLGETQDAQFFAFIRDITDPIATRVRLERLNTLYALLNRAGETLFASTSVQEVYESVCRMAVDDGPFTRVWVGSVERAMDRVLPIAWAGSGGDNVRDCFETNGLSLSANDGPTARAVRTACAVVENDIARAAHDTPCHASSFQHGITASATLPVVVAGEVVAVVTFDAGSAGFFSDEIIGLLGEVTRQIAMVMQALGADERRRAEAELRRAYERVQASDERFAVAMAASSEGIWEVDIRTLTLSFNDTYATMLGYLPTEMPRQVDPWRQLLHADDRERVWSDFGASLLKDTQFAHEFLLRAKGGTYRWMQVRGRVIERDKHGTAVRVVGTQTDLTTRREAEDETRRARELADSANRAKSAFLAVMSHEIRTPLNGVIAMAEILAQSPLPPGDADAVQTIRDSAGSLLAVIDDVLDFSKIEAGRLQMDLSDVSLQDLSETLAASLLPVADARDVDLLLFVAPEVPRLVHADPTRVRQILYNLVGNAIKFSAGWPEHRGRVELRLEVDRESPLRLSLQVIDTGIGMTPETIGRLFTSFTQAEVATTRKFGGTGLGLAITKRLVEMMHGTIEVRSTLGAGSTFTVSLPLQVVDAAPAGPAYDLTGVDCVVVEAELFCGPRDVQRHLAFAGARVVLAPDVTSAVASAWKAGGTSVVLLALNGHVLDIDPAIGGLPDARVVALVRGSRNRLSIEAPNVVSLDCDVMRARRLVRAVAVAAGRASPEVIYEEEGKAARIERAAPTTVDEARAQGRLILVAEDDRTNQKVILRQLALLGHAAEVAEDGRQALVMWRTRPYALLLTDLHMPEMDGYMLTQAIRAEETPGRRVPIVALTANALHGEELRARAVGVDGYLTKPVPLNTLRALLDRYITRSTVAAVPPVDGTDDRPAVTPDEGVPSAMMDVSVLERLVGADPGIVLEFLGDFQRSARVMTAEYLQAHDTGDLKGVIAVAHKLKSASRSCGALLFGDLCADIEKAGKSHDVEALAAHRQSFAAVWMAVDAELTARLTPS